MKKIGFLFMILFFFYIFNIYVKAVHLPKSENIFLLSTFVISPLQASEIIALDDADQGVQFDEEGNLVMITYDAKSDLSITYQTLGWTIKKEMLPIEDETQLTVTVNLDKIGSRDDPDNPGFQYTYFYFSVEELFTRIGEVSKEWQENLFQYGGMLYLDCVMTVCHSGIPQGSLLNGGRNSIGEVYYTYEGIAGARGWGAASLESLKTHFNKDVYFAPHPEWVPELPDETEEYIEYEQFHYNGTNLSVISEAQIVSDEYDVIKGIPTSEAVNVLAEITPYAYIMQIKRVSGSKQYIVPVEAEYTLVWTDETGKRNTENRTRHYYYPVIRNYTYRYLLSCKIYGAQQVVIENAALDGEYAVLLASGLPEIEIRSDSQRIAHVVEPTISTVYINGGIIDGGNKKPSVPRDDFTEEAEEQIEEILVCNDYISIDHTVLMDDEYVQTQTESARKPAEKLEYLSIENIVIPSNRANEIYDSIGKVEYHGYFFNCTGMERLNSYINEVNPIFVHTPVICEGSVSDEKWLNQMTEPIDGIPSLILGRNFIIDVSAEGMHNDIKGYGDRDYSKYVNRKEVRFPFDVEYEGEVVPSGSWIVADDIKEFYLPVEVSEGMYTISYRTISENAEVVWNAEEQTEVYANYGRENYIAVDEVVVMVMGRIFDMKVTDIKDYPRWQGIFEPPFALNSFDYGYSVGVRNQNGEWVSRQGIFTLPVFSGSNPKNLDSGAVKTGYHYIFSLTTIGGYYGSNDTIFIQKSYDYINKKTGERFPVDLYYSETKGGFVHHMISYEEEIILKDSDRTLSDNSYAIQNWTGHDYIPQKVYAIKKGEALPSYGIDEKTWLHNGYIVVNYQIWAKNGEKVQLDYLNQKNKLNGYCNMWQLEGFLYGKTDYEGVFHMLKDGDVIFYDLDHSLLEDYFHFGTH